MNELIVNGAFTLGGFLMSVAYEKLKDRYQFKRELKQNNEIDLTGFDWVAAWQTSVESKELINTEKLLIEQKGSLVNMRNTAKSPENPKGGYKWVARLQFYHGRDLMGHYFAEKEEQNNNKGIMYFSYQSAKKEFIGRWVGTGHDGPLQSGFAVISKNREQSLQRLNEILKAHPNKVSIISYSI